MTVQDFQLRVANKNPCRVATTADIATLAGGAPDTVDGVSLAAGDRVLVKEQSSGAENGIYKVDTVGTGSNGSWSRALDMDDVEFDAIRAGLNTYIAEGTANTKKTFYMTTSGAITLGTTPLTFESGPTAGAAPLQGSTGATDNAILRSDGTGGSTIQASDILIDDSGNITPGVNDGGALGTSSLGWSDLFLASGSVVNFNSGDVTITHAANSLTVEGATTTTFASNVSPDSGGTRNLGDTLTPWNNLYLDSGGQINWDTANARILHSAGRLDYSATSGHFFSGAVIAPFSNDGGALGNTTRQWSDLFLASGGVVNFNNGDVTITHSSNQITFEGATSGYEFDNPLFVEEQAAALADQAGKGQLWVRNDSPNVLVFTDDTGTDWDLNTPGGAIGGSVGTVDNSIPRASGTGGSTLQGGVASNNILIDDSGNITPEVNNGGALGTSSLGWSDLFLASGSVVNFNSGDVTITHAANSLTLAGGTAGYTFNDGPLFVEEQAAALADQAGKGQLWVRDDSPNVLVFTDDTGTDIVLDGSATLTTQTNAVYVSKAGDNANSGLNIEATKLTIGAALTVASGLAPSASNRIEVRILDAGIYNESINVPSYVSLIGPSATVTGTAGRLVDVNLDSLVRLHKVETTGGASTSCIYGQAQGRAWIYVDEIDQQSTGLSSIGIRTNNTDTDFYINVGKIIVGEGTAIEESFSGQIYGNVGEIEITSTGRGIYTDSSGKVNLQVGRIFDSGTASAGIDIRGGSTEASVVVGTLDTATTYAVTSGSTLNLLAGEITGTTGTVAGTANVTEAGALSGTTGATDDALLRADGTGGATVQASGVTIDDSDNLAGVTSLTMPEQATAPVAPGAAAGSYWVQPEGTTTRPMFTDESNRDMPLIRSMVLTRSMPSVSTDTVELGTFNGSQNSFGLVVQGGTVNSADYMAYHRVSYLSNNTGGFVIHRPQFATTQNPAAFGDLVQIEIEVELSGNLKIRARSYIRVVTSCQFRIIFDGDDRSVFTESSTQSTTTVPTDSYQNSMLTQTNLISTGGGSGIVAWRPLYIQEQAADSGNSPGFGQIWVRDDNPNTLVFTDDAGNDNVLINGSTGSVDNALVRASGTGGNSLQGGTAASEVLMDDSGNLYSLGTSNLGTDTDGWVTAYLTEVVGNGTGLTVKGKDAASGASDDVAVKSGNATLGASGDLLLGTGTAATTAGNVELVPGGTTTAAFTDGGGVNFAQSSSAPTVGSNQGAFWVLDSSVTSPMFTDDLGDDHNLLNWSPVKRPCRLATTANITSLVGGAPDTVDSVSVSAGDRILVKDQSTGSQNGIYRVVTVGTGSNGSWLRELDFNDATTDHIEAGVETYIQEGTTHNQTRFTLTTTGTIVLGTTSLTFTAL